jgi:uncharacterized protein YtpQ (UPF0354 family)
MITLTPSTATKTSVNLVGKQVRCVIPTSFTDGTKHKIGDLITVTEETNAYYNLFLGQGYRLVIK